MRALQTFVNMYEMCLCDGAMGGKGIHNNYMIIRTPTPGNPTPTQYWFRWGDPGSALILLDNYLWWRAGIACRWQTCTTRPVTGLTGQ